MSVAEPELRRVTHTFTSADGVVVVVQGVPAEVFVEGDDEHTMYDADVAFRLDELIRDALLASPTPGSVMSLAFDATSAKPVADLEFHLTGASVRYGEASVKIWRLALDRISQAYSGLAQTLAEIRGVPFKDVPEGIIAFAGDGSLVFGLRAGDASAMFDAPMLPTEVSMEAMRLIVDAKARLETTSEAFDSEDDAKVMTAALWALEELSPSGSDGIDAVRIVPTGPNMRGRSEVTLVPGTRKLAAERRLAVRTKSDGVRAVTIAGTIDQIRLGAENTFHVHDLIMAPENWGTVAKVTYTDVLLDDLLAAFRAREPVTVTGLQRQRAGRWLPTLEAISLDVSDVQEGEP